MQTFLPYSDFKKSALIIDKKRSWKQVVEAKQILCILRYKNCPEEWKQSKTYINQPFKNHPAVKMWKGYENTLAQYYNDFLEISKTVHKINTTMCTLLINEDLKIPWWMENENFHKAMRARLYFKDPVFYKDIFNKDKDFNNSQYFWPVNESKTFKII